MVIIQEWNSQVVPTLYEDVSRTCEVGGASSGLAPMALDRCCSALNFHPFNFGARDQEVELCYQATPQLLFTVFL